MSDVLLVEVPARWRFPAAQWCLTYRYLAAALRAAGFSADVVQPPFVTDGSARGRLVADVVARSPRLVGLTTYDAGLRELLGLVADLRRAGLTAHVTLGGLCATAAADRILQQAPGVDSVVRGEGEVSLVELAEYVVRGKGQLPIAGTVVRTDRGTSRGEARPFVEHLDDLPPPCWDDVAPGGPASSARPALDYVPATGSRGCYGRCSFCSVERFYRSSPRSRPWRAWSPARVADDAVRAAQATGLRQVTFVDENFLGPGRNGYRQAVRVAEELVRRGRPVAFNAACRANDVEEGLFRTLQDAGLNAVTLGVESMSERALDLFQKNLTPAVNARALAVLNGLGIDTEITYIFFDPLTTLDDVRRSLAFVADVDRLPRAYFSKGQPFTEYLPLAGTALTARLERLGRVTGDVGAYSADYADTRVGLLARTVTAVPLDDLAALRLALPEHAGGGVLEVRDRLAAYHRRLATRRLPELLSAACDAFDRGAGPGDPRIRSVVAAMAAESATIRSLVDRFVAHVAREERHGPAVSGDVLVR